MISEREKRQRQMTIFYDTASATFFFRFGTLLWKGFCAYFLFFPFFVFLFFSLLPDSSGGVEVSSVFFLPSVKFPDLRNITAIFPGFFF